MKPWYRSTTMWGGIAAVVLSSSGLAIDIDFTTGDFHGNIYALGSQIGTLLGGVVAVLGRLRSKTTIATPARRRSARHV